MIEQQGLTHAFAELALGEEKRWSVEAFPTVFLIDRRGMVQARIVGGEPDEALIERLLNETAPSPNTGALSK